MPWDSEEGRMTVTGHARKVSRDKAAVEMDLGRTEPAGPPCALCLWSPKASVQSIASSKFCLS